MQKSIKPKLKSLIIVVLIFSAVRVGAADFETWTFAGGQTKIRNMDFFFHSANFFRDGGDYFLNHTQLTLDFPSEKSISFGVGYKQEYVEFPTRWRAEYRPMLHMYYNKSFGNFSFRDRSRWEFRFYDGELINRYRNQLQLMYKKFKVVSPYISTEFSFYFDEFGYSRQRTILGSFIHVKNVNFNLFLGHQINEDYLDVWKHKLILGTGMSYKF
ncbi:DUF2490 domain-containing protein [Maribellus maritimus]|uniref:DUF2490 domain-containing protein n=1 Tax=Maribellus maritimus TaxID=2870838 RepID=UPI001EEC6BB9|nr:DUF2490 domain-containing protein [Maribellus maritimus]MCG6186029.1 DUF2490 domain-containing protein [Maribellus maritimus]